jgi:hypothetical protein
VAVAVGAGLAVGSSVKVGGMGEGVNVGGTGAKAGVHPFAKTVSTVNTRMNKVDFSMALSPYCSILAEASTRFHTNIFRIRPESGGIHGSFSTKSSFSSYMPLP